MCGRYTLKMPDRVAWAAERLFELKLRVEARYNFAPSQVAKVIAREATGEVVVAEMSWGFRARWAKEGAGHPAPINARIEGIAAKPMFREAVRRRRCVVPADGFYEWRRGPEGVKTPMHIHFADERAFFMAGIWEEAGEGEAATFAVLTTRPNELMATIHDRMPVVLEGERARAWVAAGEVGEVSWAEWAEPFPAVEMAAYAVSSVVNSARFDGPECVAAAAAGSEGPQQISFGF
jgi:putative SOS response-associated peptidase YedK